MKIPYINLFKINLFRKRKVLLDTLEYFLYGIELKNAFSVMSQ